MSRRRRLEDLYVIGRELSLDDGNDDPVVVWLQKLSPLDHDKAIRRAAAAKARVLITRHDHDTESWQQAYSDVDELGGRDALVEYLIAEEAAQIRESAERELAFAEEWSKDGYLTGLQDLWEDEEKPMNVKYAEDPEDPDARRIFLELKRFSDTVEEKVAPEIEGLKRDYVEMPEEEIRERAVGQLIDLKSGLAWLREYRHCEVFFATREVGNHDVYYFSHHETVDRLATEVFVELSNAYQEMVVDIASGKDSPKSTSSSPSSEPPSEEEPSPVSGPLVAVP
jgi:hypothetical protein